MPRPSRNVDVQLLSAGRDLYPAMGAAGLSVRKVAERAGVNLGMFHYHFGSKDVFVRALLQSLYEEMFADLQTAAAAPVDPVAGLRAALKVIARFARDNRVLLRRLMVDAAAGEAPAVDFVSANFPRHFGVVVGLIAAAQQHGRIKPIALAQAVTFVAGAIAAPILLGSAIVDSGLAPPILAERFAADVLADAALDERIELALTSLLVSRSAST
jgi:AcrR family transcriptional regulator